MVITNATSPFLLWAQSLTRVTLQMSDRETKAGRDAADGAIDVISDEQQPSTTTTTTTTAVDGGGSPPSLLASSTH